MDFIGFFGVRMYMYGAEIIQKNGCGRNLVNLMGRLRVVSQATGGMTICS